MCLDSNTSPCLVSVRLAHRLEAAFEYSGKQAKMAPYTISLHAMQANNNRDCALWCVQLTQKKGNSRLYTRRKITFTCVCVLS